MAVILPFYPPKALVDFAAIMDECNTNERDRDRENQEFCTYEQQDQ